MSSVVEATPAQLIKSTSTSATYQSASFKETYCVGAVPNGGYSLGCINVCVHDFLANHLHSSHTDLFHVSSTYLNATDGKQGWMLDIQVTKKGKGFTNLDANLIQKSHKTDEMTIRLQARFIYTDFSKNHTDPSTDRLSLQPDSSFYTAFPCLSKPGENRKSQYQDYKKIHFRNHLGVYRDLKAEVAFREKGELNCSGYMNFLQEKVAKADVAHFNNAAIVMFADMTEKSLEYLPKGSEGESSFWYPTMFLSIEMKRALPSFPLLGVADLVRTRHVEHGQFEIDVEIWSHPDDAERLQLPKGVKSVILCIARQVALTIPLSAQAGITAKKEVAKL